MRASLRDLRRLTAVHLMWVPAHAGIIQNEIADSLAKRGAHGVSSRAAPKMITSHRNTRAAAALPISHDLDCADDLPEDEDSEDELDVPLPPAPESIAPVTSSRRSKRLRPEPTPAFVYHDTPIRFLD